MDVHVSDCVYVLTYSVRGVICANMYQCMSVWSIYVCI